MRCQYKTKFKTRLGWGDVFLHCLLFTVATIAERTINVMQYDGKWASSYANFGIALQFISEWSSGCGFVKLFKKFPRPEDIKIIKLLKMIGHVLPDKNRKIYLLG